QFRSSQALDPSPSALVKIARCFEHERDPKSAFMTYDAALELIRLHPRDAGHARELEALVLAAQQQLAKQLGRVTLERGALPSGVSISVDTQPLSGVALDQPLMLIPGLHRIEAEAEGYLPTVIEVTITADTSRKVELTMDPDPNASPAVSPTQRSASVPIGHSPLSTSDVAQANSKPAPQAHDTVLTTAKPLLSLDTTGPTPASAPSARSKNDTKSIGERRLGKGQRIWGVVTGATGAALLGVAGYLGWRTRALTNDARVDNHCDANYSCDAVGMDRIHRAERAQLQTIVAATSGVVFLGTGIVLYATAGSQKLPSAGRQWRMLLMPLGGSMEGSF
ncbi:MAG TPA: hypothetical protein VIV60_24970, partial [Polyangiaceae bacterium]